MSPQLLAFEAYRDLVKTAGQSELAGLAAAQDENLQIRASARSAAAESTGANAVRRLPVASPATPAGAHGRLRGRISIGIPIKAKHGA